MADLAKLKKKAAEFEAAKKFDKAIATYREILDLFDLGEEGEVDVALYNRVGDLLMRQGDTAEAVTLYERAVDLYAEGGFFNNAIALCNKVLRTSPGRASVYYKLGKISAAKGFKGDAKQNFLEYAARMQKAGQKDEAFRALKEFADLCPDQDDIRLMLADQLLKAERKDEALEQLSSLYERLLAAGQTAEAESTMERMRAIDPAAKMKTGRKSREAKSSDDLIFIDLDAPTPRKSTLSVKIPEVVAPPRVVPAEPEPVPAMVVEPTSVPAPPAALPTDPQRPAGIGTGGDVAAGDAESEFGELVGLEPTSLVVEDADEGTPMSVSEFSVLDLSVVKEAEVPRRPSTGRDLALVGELPLLDLSLDAVVAQPADSLDAGLSLIDILPEERAAPDLSFGDIEFVDLNAPPADAPGPEVDAAVDFGEIDLESVEEPPPPVRRTITMSIPIIAASVEDLRVQVEQEPENWELRRQLAETVLDDGNRDEGLAMLEEALVGFERAGRIHEARSVADEIVRLNPASVRHHQKRVEFAFRDDDRAGLAQAYLDLADALFREGLADKARTVYLRVLEISPDDVRAIAALEALTGAEHKPAPASPPVASPPVASAHAASASGRRYTGMLAAVPDEAPPVPASAPVTGGDGDYVSLGDWLREDDEPKSTRMVVEEQEPTGDENADFQDMLRKFKQGVAENVEEEDHESHYDLGVAYKEMGLLDEAIAEFQKALRGTQRRVRTYEALGQCFLEKGQLPVARTILQRALAEPGAGDDQLVGVLYLMGYASEGLKKPDEAMGFYERVFAVDIQFRDIGERLNAVESARS